MTGVYATQIANAKRQIAAKGEACMWAFPAAATEDPDSPWLTTDGATPAPVAVKILMLPGRSPFQKFNKDTEAVGGSMYGLMGAVDFVPVKTGIVTRSNGTKLSIVSIDSLEPNGSPILYTIEFAK